MLPKTLYLFFLSETYEKDSFRAIDADVRFLARTLTPAVTELNTVDIWNREINDITRWPSINMSKFSLLNFRSTNTI